MARKRRHQQLFVRAVQAQVDGRLADAERSLRRLLRDKPRDHEALHQLGLVLWQHDPTTVSPAALDALESAAAMAPTDGRYQANLGNVYQAMGNTRAAISAMERAVALLPSHARGWSNLGVALRVAGRIAESIDALRRATTLAPDNVIAWQNLGSALEQHGETDAAVTALERASALAPADPEVWTALGKLAEQQDRAPEAESLYRRALLCDRDHAPAWSNLGGLYRQQGRLEASIQACERAIAADPELVDAYTHFGLALREQGHPGPAAATWQRGLQVEATPEALLNLSDVLSELGQDARSEAALLELLERFPSFGPGWLARGRALLSQSKPDQAGEAFRMALSLSPSDAEAQHFLRAASGAPSSRAPAAYVRRLFDEYAGRFDAHLTGALGYQTPTALVELLGDGPFKTIVDLGCGTGLVGPLVRERCHRLVGIDLSPRMLDKAREKKVYDELVAGAIEEVFGTIGPVAVALAADVLIYFGDLAPILSAGQPDRFLLSVEAHQGPEDWVLRPTGRYAHSAAYVHRAAAAAGFVVEQERQAPLRKEQGVWVEGLLFSLRCVNPAPSA